MPQHKEISPFTHLLNACASKGLPFDPDTWVPEKNPDFVAWYDSVIRLKGETLSNPAEVLTMSALALIFSPEIIYEVGNNCYTYGLGDRSAVIVRSCHDPNLGVLSLLSALPPPTIKIPGDGWTMDMPLKDVLAAPLDIMSKLMCYPEVIAQLLEADGCIPAQKLNLLKTDFRLLALYVCKGVCFHLVRQF